MAEILLPKSLRSDQRFIRNSFISLCLKFEKSADVHLETTC